MVKHLKIRVEGRVQGVAFRQTTLEEASRLGLKGTVQNLPDGSVEIHAEGEEEALQKLVEWCEVGPGHANVSRVQRSEEELRHYSSFKII